jgi:hypothetical protein
VSCAIFTLDGKLTLAHRILGFDAPTCILLVAAPSTSVKSSQVSTLLVDLSMLILGQSPFAKDLYAEQDGYRSSSYATSTDTQARTAVLVNREKLSLAPGEFVCIVGWLEGEITKSTPKVRRDYNFELLSYVLIIRVGDSH